MDTTTVIKISGVVCQCGNRISTIKKFLNHLVNSRHIGEVTCYCDTLVNQDSAQAHLASCKYLGTFGCTNCGVRHTDFISANNHAWSAHGNGKHSFKLQPTVVFGFAELDAQIKGTKWAHMQYTQLEEKARNNNLKRCILRDLVRESDFTASGSHFYRLAALTRNRAPLFTKSQGRRCELTVNCQDGPVTLLLNQNDKEFVDVMRHVSDYLVMDAQAWGIPINHTHSVDSPELGAFIAKATACLESLGTSVPLVQQIVSGLCKLCVAVRSAFDPTTVALLVTDLLVGGGVSLDLAQKAYNACKEHALVAFSFLSRHLSNTLSAQADSDPYLSIATVIAVLGGTLLLKDVPRDSQVAECIGGVSKLGALARGATFAWAGLEKVMTFVLNKIYEWHTGFPSTIGEIESFVKGTQDWYSRVHDLVSLNTAEDIGKSSEMCTRIEGLYHEGLRLKAMIQDYKLEPRLVSAFDMHYRVVQQMYDRAASSGAMRGGPRVEPLVIYMFGASGVGKTGMLHALGIDLLKIDGISGDDFTKDIYFRMIEQEFWDGYSGQRVVVYDDFAQMRDSVANPNLEYMELIRTGNLAPMPLHMAHLEEKAKSFFKSRVVMCTSNVEPSRNRPESLAHAAAYQRRLKICVRVTNRVEFTTLDDDRVRRLDKNKVREITGKGHSLQPYILQRVDPLTGYNIGHPMSYAAFRDMCVRAYRRQFSQSTELFEFLKEHADEPLEAQIDPVVHASLQKPSAEVFLKDPKQEMLSWSMSKVRTFMDGGLYEVAPIFTEEVNTQFAFMQEEGWAHLIESADPDELLGLEQSWEETINSFDEIYVEDVEKIVLHAVRASGMGSNFGFIGVLPVERRLKHVAAFIKSTRVKRTVMDEICEELQTQARTASEVAKSWLQQARDSILAHPWLAASAAIVGALALWWMTRSSPKDMSPLNHHHLGLALGRHVEHAHLCEICGKYYRHSHTIKSYEDSLKYGQACTECASVVKDQLFIEAPVDLRTKVYEKIRARKEIETELSNSGDATTKAKAIVKTELTTSGDAATKSRSVVRTELTSSGDPRTAKATKIKVELAGDDVVLMDEFNSDLMDAQLASDPNALQISKRVLNNMYNIEIKRNGVWGAGVKMMMLKGRTAITVAHLKPYLDQASHLRIWNATKKQGHEFAVSDCSFVQVTNSKGVNKDQMLISFPTSLHDHANVLGSIATSEEMSKFTRANACVVVPCEFGAIMRFGPVTAFDNDSRHYGDDLGNKYSVRDRYEYYNLETTNGDCGSILVAIGTSISRKLLGMHVCGKLQLGVSSPFNADDIKRALVELPIEAQIGLDLSPLLSSHGSLHDIALPEGNFTPVGKSLYKTVTPSATKLRPSEIAGKIADVTMAPSALGPIIVDGKKVDPMQLGLKKAGNIPPEVNQKSLDAAINDVKRLVLANPKEEDRKVFSPMEAVTGIEGDEFISAISRKSSPGYPYMKSREGKPGKTKWLGEGTDFKLDKELEAQMLERIEKAKKGERTPTVFVDTLKDERRSKEKVRIGRTRVFSAGPMDFTLVFRMYFLGFAAHVMRNRIDNEISVGTNVYSFDWTKTAERVRSKGQKVIAGDFSNFDGTLLLPMLYQILDIINEFYDDGNDLIRHVLWKEIVNSVHLCGDNVYLWTHSQPSGCPITALLNSIFNSVSMRYVWMEMMPKELCSMRDFNHHVAMVSYGDDNLVNIADAVIDYFNQITIAEGYAKIGMTYTDEAKSGTMVPFRSLVECGYLKRGFTYLQEEMQWVAPLEMATIMEMTNWVRGDDDRLENTLANVETSAFELSLHGKEIYDEWMPVYARACRDLPKFPFLPTFAEQRENELRKHGRLN